MENITEFCKIRQDGKVIDENMTLDQLMEWPSDLVIRIRWRHGNKFIEIYNQYGVWAYLVPDKKAAVVIEGNSDNLPTTAMRVVNPDGTKRFSIPNRQNINGITMVGAFMWYEKPRVEIPSAFGIVFNAGNYGYFQLDIDSRDGKILGVYPTR